MTLRICPRLAVTMLLAAGSVLGTASAQTMPEAAPKKPNFVLLLIDDGGFTDLGVYGGEARTPNIDALAQQGAMFTSYHSSPLCSPSRAMLLTGMDNHRTGVGTIPETLPADQQGKRGYSMRLEPGVQTVATRLKQQGYRSYMTGKWHLGHGAGDLPDAHGFDHSFVLDASGADNYEQKPYMPYYTSADWFEDGQPATLPDNFYSSAFVIDKMVDYLERDKARAEPFFAYIGFQAVHIPVQAPKEFTAHYQGVYDQGWEVLRQKRWQQAKARGLIPADAPLAPAHEKLRAWDSLSPDERAIYAKSMAVHAGMLEAMDLHIGRLITYLKERGEYENTVFLLTSDNGPEPSNPIAQTGFSTWMSRHGYTHQLDNLGEKGSLVFIGPEWANATASPGNLFKFHSSEGGIRVPLIAAGPGIVAGQRIASTSFVTDVTPTVFDFAGLDPARWSGTVPVAGKSLKGVLSGAAASTHGPDEAIGIEVGGNAALFKGDYKLSKVSLPWGDAKWRLYNLAADPGETKDLRSESPERFSAMLADYEQYATDVGVLELPDDFDPFKQVKINATKKQLHLYRFHLIGGALVLAIAAVLLWYRRKAR
ncbi:MAG: sulfatase-like hydrolase/transferase [Pseudomonadota bacterium]